MKQPRQTSILAVASTALVVVFMVLWLTTYLPLFNFGMPFGYYGEFNRVVAQIRDIPGVEIIYLHAHEDVTLEGFWMTVRLNAHEEIDLEFHPQIETMEEMQRKVDAFRDQATRASPSHAR